jgi:hypothetical protein
MLGRPSAPNPGALGVRIMRLVATGVLSLLGALLCVSTPANADVVVAVSKSQQQMAVVVDGEQVFRWPVSTGRRGYDTPDGVFHAKSVNREWFSRQYDMTPMPWSVFFYQGYALHGTTDARNLGHAASHGCVRLDIDNAAILFALVNEQGIENTKVMITERALPPLRKAAPTLIAEIERGARAWVAAQTVQAGGEEPQTAKTQPADEPRVAANPDRAAHPKAADKTSADAAPQPIASPPIEPLPAEPVQATPQPVASQPVVPPPPAIQDAKLAEPELEPKALPTPLPVPATQDAQPPQLAPQAVAPPQAQRVEADAQDVRLPLPAPRLRAEPDNRLRGETHYATARGDDAQVMRERAAWLRELARKYGYERW